MLLAIAGMFGVTSCGEDACACAKAAAEKEDAKEMADAMKACQGDMDDEAFAKALDACEESEGEEGGEE